MTTYNTLRDANIARQREWVTGAPLSPSFRGNELGGELGEVAEVLLGANHVASHYREQFIEALGSEIADGIICVDLTAITCNAAPCVASAGHHAVLSDIQWAAQMLLKVGKLQNVLKKYDRVLLGIKGGVLPSVTDVEHRLNDIHQSLHDLARSYGIDPNEAVAKKFNHTSIKVGLETRLTTSGV